jgi:hypothetical protein
MCNRGANQIQHFLSQHLSQEVYVKADWKGSKYYRSPWSGVVLDLAKLPATTQKIVQDVEKMDKSATSTAVGKPNQYFQVLTYMDEWTNK